MSVDFALVLFVLVCASNALSVLGFVLTSSRLGYIKQFDVPLGKALAYGRSMVPQLDQGTSSGKNHGVSTS